jgi:hypothetical protein
MNEDTNRLDSSKKSAALNRLAEHLTSLDAQAESTLPRESEMLSQIVSGILNGEDIAQRYPAFYQKLLEHAELRQAFLDALEAVEAERAGQLTPLPGASNTNLAFLSNLPPAPTLEILSQDHWRATWQRSFEQIRVIFSPPELAYRADTSAIEDPWFTLLRADINTAGSSYAVVLDCTLATETDNALAAYLNLAVTLESPTPAQFPLRASLQWGTYHESLLITEEGRVRFPDIPLLDISDSALGEIQAGFSLTLGTAS